MSDAQREVLTSLLDQIYASFVACVASGRGKAEADVEALLAAPAPPPTPAQLASAGWLTGTMYADELALQLAARTGPQGGGGGGGLLGARRRGPQTVDVASYSRTRPQALGLDLGPPVVGLLRASGAISRGRAGAGGGAGIRHAFGCVMAMRGFGSYPPNCPFSVAHSRAHRTKRGATPPGATTSWSSWGG